MGMDFCYISHVLLEKPGGDFKFRLSEQKVSVRRSFFLKRLIMFSRESLCLTGMIGSLDNTHQIQL